MGGVIAASYASQFSGFPSADNTRLAGIIALDSPLNGISQDSNVASCYPQALSWLSFIVGGRQNLPIIGELTPGNAEVNGIETASQHAPVLSIGSADDCFIPPADTYIAGGQNSIVHSGGTPGDIDSLHGAVRNDNNAINIITAWIAAQDNSGGTSTPQPTTTSTPTSTTTPTPPCTASGDGVTLFVDPSYGGACHTFGVGEYSDLSQFGLDQNVSSLQDTNANYHITFFDQTGLTGTPGYYDANTPQLTGYWDNRARSMRVERHATNGVTLCADGTYGGTCHTFGVGEYSDLSQFGLDQNVSSLRDANAAYHITLFDQKGLTGTPGYYDADTSQLTGYWDNRARSMRVEKHRPTTCNPGTDGIIAYIDTNYQAGCLFITGDIPDLTTYNFEQVISSIRFAGNYTNSEQIAIYRQANYQDLCGTYTQDQSDLLSCSDQAVSIRVLPFTPPQQAQNLAPSAILDHPGSGNAVDNDLSTEWLGGHSVPLGLVFASPVTIQDVVVFDRAQSSTDNNQINKIQLVFSDGTVINNIDMTSGGPRCADVSFPAKQVSWVNVVPTDSSGNNGFKEIQIWDTSGTVYSQNNCVMKFSLTPVPGSGPAPLIQPPTPTPTPSPTATASCPAGWTCADIGGPNLTGSESLNNGTWSIQGSGGDIWNTSDQFHYNWQTLSGDGSASAQILSQDNTDGWAKAGVMFRQDNTAGSAFYLVALTPGNGITVQYRTDQGASAQMNAQINGTAPVYIMAIRSGNTFTAATSSDGVNWNTISGSSATLNVSGAMLVGLAITSHSASLGTATFNTVTVTAGSTPSPTPSPTATTPTPTTSPSPTSNGVELLSAPWHLTGNNGAAELYQSVDPNVLNGMTRVQITYNLHGLQALGGDASAIIIDQNGWHYISLSDYGQNGLDGNQTVIIPLSDFGLDLTQPIDGTIHTRFWYGSQFTVDIISIQLLP